MTEAKDNPIIQTKSLTVETMDEQGKGLARLATLSAVDHDGDTYEPGAFSWKEGGHQWAPIIPAHHRGKPPFGKARVYEEDDAALADLNLNLDTAAGRDWHAVLMFDLKTGQPVQEWSYGYDTLDAGFAQRGYDRVQVLKKLDVHEVSTVVRGAGIGSRTVMMKSAALKDRHFEKLLAELGTLKEAIGEDATSLSATGVKQLGEIHVAIGGVLAGIGPGPESELSAEAKTLADQAVGSYMRFLSREHLKAR